MRPCRISGFAFGRLMRGVLRSKTPSQTP
jgi:hypothetical protein